MLVKIGTNLKLKIRYLTQGNKYLLLKDLFKTLEEFSAEGQVINGGNGEYYDSFYAPNIIYDENSELLAPYKVSNCGYYNEETKTACWDRLCGIKKLYLYDFSLIRYSFLTQILKVLINFS